MAFSAIRIGAYETVKQKYIQISGAEGTLTLLGVRIAAGVTTGTMAILSAQPTDVVKIRMQAELIKPGEKSRYNGVMHAYKTVFKEEGIAGKIRLVHKYILKTDFKRMSLFKWLKPFKRDIRFKSVFNCMNQKYPSQHAY